jgi:hypothetical protein
MPYPVSSVRNRNIGGVSDTTAPTVTGFAATSPSGLTIAITSFTASEAGVYFLITESSTPPAVDAAGWNLSAPTTYAVLTTGAKTLYPWVKDSAGNVSSAYGSPVAVQVYILLDNFTDPNDTLLTAHTPNVNNAGGSWSATFNNFGTANPLKITSNQATMALPGATCVGGSVIETGQSNCILQADVTTINDSSTGNNGVIFRYVDSSNYLYADMLTNAGASGVVRIRKVQAGSDTILATSSAGVLAANTTYTMVITLSGNSISVTAASKNVNTTNTFNETATKHGPMIVARTTSASKVDSLSLVNP